MQKTFLSEAFASSDRMVHIINDFLNVSRLQTGKFVLDKTTGNLESVVKEEIEGLESSANSRGLKLKLTSEGKTPVFEADFDKLRQVVMNMIDNAIYYSKPDQTIKISLTNTEDRIIFKVVDKGIGVPKDEQDGLFGKFYRTSNARRQRPDGTGVGLFLARKVVLDHKGDVIFESEEGQGSIFGFWIPIKK
jgi:signal transduction histidine kinase